MRMSTDDDRDERLGLETIAAAAEGGVTVFDTAHAYGLGADELDTTSASWLERCAVAVGKGLRES